MPVRWGVHQIPQITLDLNLSRCRVALRPAVLSAARIWPSVSRCLEISFGLRGPSPQAFTPFRGGVGSLPGAWGAPNKGNARGPRVFLTNSRRVWATALRRSHPKRPCAIHARKVGRASNTADHSRSEPLQVSGSASGPPCLSAARIWPSVSRCLEISFGLRGPSPQAFTSFGRVGFIARRLRRP